jgi:16S rRNA (cytosine1402-N4)-methyltransferase
MSEVLSRAPHIPVLLTPILDTLLPDGRRIERVIDGTVGAGGHARAFLDAGAGGLLGFDLDPQALALAGRLLEPDLKSGRATLVHASYATMTHHAGLHGWRDGVDAILLDLGVSSMQLDTAERGFAFMKDGPLDMRFDPSQGTMTAADIVNFWDADSIADVLYRYGEERDSRRVARIIIAGRPFETTRQLADVIKAAQRPVRGKPEPIHPATRSFQALRIAVNDELTVVEQAIPRALELLRPGGRLGIISFHSLEDRLVKHAFKEAATEIIAPPGMVIPEKQATVRLITRKPIEADDAERVSNPRSRSAKFRVVEKL